MRAHSEFDATMLQYFDASSKTAESTCKHPEDLQWLRNVKEGGVTTMGARDMVFKAKKERKEEAMLAKEKSKRKSDAEMAVSQFILQDER